MRTQAQQPQAVPTSDDNVHMEELECPCGLGEKYDSCCGRYHSGTPAPTAEQLMRSRYTAFALGDADYLLRTWHPSARPRTLKLDPMCAWRRRLDAARPPRAIETTVRKAPRLRE